MITDVVFVSIDVKESSYSEPYELLLRLENIVEIGQKRESGYITFKTLDEQDTLLLAEPISTVIKKLLGAGAGISR